MKNDLPRLKIQPLRPDWMWRHTSRGFALIGALIAPCQSGMSTDGLVNFTWQSSRMAHIQKPMTYTQYKELLHGSVRYRYDEGFGTFTHESGPFIVNYWSIPAPEKRGGAWSVQVPRCQLVCVCGWEGKRRSIHGARYMVAEQSAHRCEHDPVSQVGY